VREPATAVSTPATGSTKIFDRGALLSTNSLDVTGSSFYEGLTLPAFDLVRRYPIETQEPDIAAVLARAQKYLIDEEFKQRFHS
jgi:hypothetical protein